VVEDAGSREAAFSDLSEALGGFAHSQMAFAYERSAREVDECRVIRKRRLGPEGRRLPETRVGTRGQLRTRDQRPSPLDGQEGSCLSRTVGTVLSLLEDEDCTLPLSPLVRAGSVTAPHTA
jgi:hypothetical protein